MRFWLWIFKVILCKRWHRRLSVGLRLNGICRAEPGCWAFMLGFKAIFPTGSTKSLAFFSVQRCTGIAEVRVRIPASLKIFRLSFRNCILSCIFNSRVMIFPVTYFLIPRWKYMKYIYSSVIFKPIIIIIIIITVLLPGVMKTGLANIL